jgi:hypothetical protein
MQARPSIAVVTRPTRMAGLLRANATKGAAMFRLRTMHAHEAQRRLMRVEAGGAADAMSDAAAGAMQIEADFSKYENEDERYQDAVSRLWRDLDFGYPLVKVDREFLPNFDFGRCVLVVVIGQDGLVANAAKYVGDLPIIGVNPDPLQYDGILVPFDLDHAGRAARQALEHRAPRRSVTLAQVTLNDGQKLLAFNDLFVGCATHVSARYTIRARRRAEAQSSSGVIVSTGAGSTGWLSSVFNMAEGVARAAGKARIARPQLDWSDRRLVWAVREPFASRHSQASMVLGSLAEGEELVIESLMPANGVIFSDGTEQDYLAFNTGSIARIGVSSQSAQLVTG